MNKNNENSSLLKKKLGGELTTTRKSSKKQLSSSSSTTTKTPRKALGNISNQNTNGLSTKTTTTRMDRTGFMKSKVVLPNKTPHTLKTNRNKLKSLSTCNNNINNKSISNSTVKSQKKKSTVLKSVSFNDHKEQIVPSNKANAAIRHSHASKIDKTVKQSVCPVEDIEYSAGQTWLQQQEFLEDDIVSECSYENHPISYKELLDNGRQERQEDMEHEQEELIKNLEEYAANLWLQDVDKLPLKGKEEDGFIEEDINDIVGELEFSPIGDELELDDDYFFDDGISL